jgi:CRP-like cAMP-binding protein
VATTVSNALIDCLPKRLQDSLRMKMEPVSLPSGTSLYRPGEKPKFAHFMTSGMASVVTAMTDGRTSEVGIWGRESMAESMHLLGPVKVPNSCFMQVAGTALRMRFSDVQEEFNTSEPLRNLVLQSIQIQGLTLEQLAACNRLHEAEQRLARWLLMVEDRVGESSYSLTQEFLGDMLGARRTTVTLAAGTLQQSGLITYRRGRIRILDRENLEAAACECYQAVRKLWRGSCFEKRLEDLAPPNHHES